MTLFRRLLAALALLPALAFSQSLQLLPQVSPVQGIPIASLPAGGTVSITDIFPDNQGTTTVGVTGAQLAAFAAANFGANTRAGQLAFNIVTYGADPTHTTDSSAAISAAVAAVNTACALSGGSPAPTLYVPYGWYKVSSAVTQFANHCPARVVGDRPFASSFDLQLTFTGCMFTSSENWNLSGGASSYNYGTTVNGAGIEGISITANTAATIDTQHGICLTNRNDQFYLRDVWLGYINGCALCIANTVSGGGALAYTRESTFNDLKVWISGSTDQPAVWVSSIMGTSNETTNQLAFTNLNIFGANGDSLVIDNCPNVAGSCGTVAGTATKGVTEITFMKTRIERAASGAYDHVRIGGTSNVGKVYNVRFFELTETAISSANTGFHVAGTGGNVYNVDVWGLMNVNGTGNLIQIDNGSQINFRGVKQNSSITTGLTVASSTNVSCCIYVENVGSAPLTLSIDPTSLNSVFSSGTFQQNGFAADLYGQITIQPPAFSSPTWGATGLIINGGTNNFTYTDTTGTGTIGNESFNTIPCGQLAATNAITVNNAPCLFIPNPTLSTNVTAGTNGALSLYAAGAILSATTIHSVGLLSTTGGFTSTGTQSINVNNAAATNINTGTSAGNVGIQSGTGSGTITIGNSTNTGKTILAGITTGTNADFLCLSAGGVVLLQTSACTISSLRFKENVEDLQGSAVPEIAKMEVASYNLKDTGNRDPNATTRQTGLIAENIAQVAPECAIYEDDMKTPKSYRQECVIALLVKATQEQAREIARLKHARHP